MSRLSWKLVFAVVLCTLVVGSVTASVGAASISHPVRLGSAPLRPAGARVIGAFPGSAKMLVTVALQPRDPAALQSYATDVATPGSSVYRHFLSVAQFRARFSPTDSQIAAVSASLRAHGLNPGAVTANGLAIPVTATASTVEHAFSVSLDRLSLANGRTAFANTAAPQLDSSIASLVQGVIGLDDLSLPRPVGLVRAARTAHAAPHATKHVATGGPQPCSTASAVASSAPGGPAYTTDQVAAAYNFSGLYGAGDEGQGQTIALYELEGNFPSDATAFESCYGISAPISYSLVDGGPPAPNPNPPAEDGLETALDIDQAVGFAPKANVIVYQGPNSNTDNLPGAGPYDTYNAIVSQDKAQVISTSWGICESQDTPTPTAQQDENTLFQEAATQGESVFSAAGDSGSADCTDPTTELPQSQLAVDDPASQPFVTGAGGTTLTSLGPPPTEKVWNDPASLLSGVCATDYGAPVACGGGGGISGTWPMPAYQSSAPGSLNVINSKSSGSPCGASAGSYCREVPDIAANADPATGYAIYYDGDGDPSDTSGWENGTPLGGTSAAAPLWAALTADANSSSSCGGLPIGFANPALYRAAAAAYSSDFHDITSGNNDATGTNGGMYPAGTRYDMASGLGTPNAANLAGALCIETVHVLSPGNQTSVSGVKTNVGITATDAPGKTLGFSAHGLPPGLSINAGDGIISGTPTTTGSYGVTVYAVDNQGAIGNTTFSWTVLTPSKAAKPKESGGSLTGVSKGKPKLTFTLTDTAGIRKLVISLPKGLSFGKKKKLSKGISVLIGGRRLTGLHFKLSRGRLTITLPKVVTQLRITLKPPAISASRSLVSKVKHHRSGKLKVSVTVTDASGRATALGFKVRPF